MLQSDLEPNLLSFFQNNSKVSTFKRGEMVYKQGDSPQGIYFIVSGLVGLTIVSKNSGKEHLLRFFKQGQFFGHRAFFANEIYHGNAVVLEPTTIQFVSKEVVLSGREKHKYLLHEVVKVLSKELRHCENQHVMILENEINVRVAQSLIYLKDLHPDHNWTRQEIANFCASTVSTVIKALAELEELNYIRQEGRSITLLDRKGLVELQDQA